MADWLSTADHAAATPPPGSWMSTDDHSSEAPGSDIGHPQLGPSPTMAKVGNTIFQDIANTPSRIMNFLSGHPLQDTLDAIRQSTAARQVHKQRALAAYREGDYKTAADQAFFGSVPFIGPALGAAADEWPEHKPEAVAHAVEILGPALADPAMNGLESEAAARAGSATTNAAQTLTTAAGGGLKGALKSSIQTIPYGRVNIPIPAPIVGAWAGGSAATQFGLPRALGAAIGGGLPLVRGAIAGAREALAARMVANPGLLDATAQLKYGKAFKDLETAAERGSVITAAGKASGKNVTLPDSVTEELTRPSEVAPPIQSTPAAATPAAGFKAGRASLFPPPVAPAPLPAIGSDPAAMYAAQQARLNTQATAPTASTAASTVPQPPPEALARLNSGVRTPARSQNPAPSVQPPAALLSRLNTGVTVNPRAAAENLFSEMQASGSVPPAARPGQPYGGEQTPPDKFIAAARQTRTTNTTALAEALHAAGVPSSDLPNVTAEEWATLAKSKNLGWPIGKPAQDAWIRDVITGVKQREGKVQ